MIHFSEYYNRPRTPESYYTDSDDTHELPMFYVKPGLAVCAYYADEWVRAEIKSIDDSKGEIEVGEISW